MEADDEEAGSPEADAGKRAQPVVIPPQRGAFPRSRG